MRFLFCMFFSIFDNQFHIIWQISALKLLHNLRTFAKRLSLGFFFFFLLSLARNWECRLKDELHWIYKSWNNKNKWMSPKWFEIETLNFVHQSAQVLHFFTLTEFEKCNWIESFYFSRSTLHWGGEKRQRKMVFMHIVWTKRRSKKMVIRSEIK